MPIDNKKIQHPQPSIPSQISSSQIPDVHQIPLVTPKPSSANIPTVGTSKSVSPELSKEERDKIKQQIGLPDTLPIVNCLARARIPTTQGPDIFLHLYENNIDNKEHLAIVFGENIRSRSLYKKRKGESQQDRMTRGAYIGRLTPGRTIADRDDVLNKELHFTEEGNLIIDEQTYCDPTLVRIHSECYTGETAWSARCDCGEQFDEAGRIMGEDGHGCIVYLRQEGRGIGLGEKLKAYNLQDLGADTVQANIMLRHPADGRDFSLATAILLDLGLMEIKLLTNNREKIVAVEGKHRLVKVLERLPMVPLSWQHKENGIHSKEIEGYLSTKIERMGHLLEKPIKIN